MLLHSHFASVAVSTLVHTIMYGLVPPCKLARGHDSVSGSENLDHMNALILLGGIRQRLCTVTNGRAILKRSHYHVCSIFHN